MSDLGAAPRSLLFVPADRLDRYLAPARQSGADALIVDLEDGVAAGRKRAAREMLAQLPAASSTQVTFVRVNPATSRFFYEDIRALDPLKIQGVVIPKVEGPDDLAAATSTLDVALPLVALIESPRGVLHVTDIARTNGLVGLAIGGEDLAARLGVVADRSLHVLAHAQSEVVLASSAYGLWAADTPTPTYTNLERVHQEASAAMAEGFTGKLLIHPAQVTPTHEAFAPTDDQVRWARSIVQGGMEAGGGATGVSGGMVDQPVLLQAQRTLERHRRSRRTTET